MIFWYFDYILVFLAADWLNPPDTYVIIGTGIDWQPFGRQVIIWTNTDLS